MNSKIFFLGAIMLLPAFASCQRGKPFPDDAVDKVYEYLPRWQAGYLDIHQISTGRDNVAYPIFSDGTTMLLDVGDLGVHSGTQEVMKVVFNDSKRPAEWIAQYMKHFSLPLKNNGALGYALFTHFDMGHIGQNGKLAIEKVGLDYKLTGITHVDNLLNISTLIDRGYPTYNYPTAAKVSGAHISNYKLYATVRDREGKKNKGFVIGSNSQIRLLKNPGPYPTLKVRNIVGNGKVWTSNGTTAKELVPSAAPSGEQLNEDRCSYGVRITYGNFDYLSTGDILGVEKAPEWFDIETPVTRLLGETDVAAASYHAYSDAVCDTYISQMKPQVYVIPIWGYYHPQPATLSRILSQTLYPDERSVFAAGMVDNNRSRLGKDGLKIKPAGHVVTRAYPGGEKFQIFVLNDRNEAYETLYKTGEIRSNN